MYIYAWTHPDLNVEQTDDYFCCIFVPGKIGNANENHF